MSKCKILLLMVFLLTIVIYSAGLHGPFVFDDIPVFVNNAAFKVDNLTFSSIHQSLNSSVTGISSRPIALFTLLLNYHFFGLDSYSYKLINLIVHLINGGLFFLVLTKIIRLTQLIYPLSIPAKAETISLCIVCIWLLHPFNLTAVLYVVQRMASLATTFMLIALLAFINMRAKQVTQASRSWQYFFWIVFALILGVYTKENSLVVVLVMFCIEVILLKQKATLPSVTRTWNFLSGIGWISILILIVLIALKWQFFKESYVERGYTLEERLLTQSRILWFYIKLILVPDITQMTLFHDDIIISKSIFQPINTLYAIIAWVLTIIAGFSQRKRYPLIWLGICWYLVSHSIESSVISLEMVFEHRNYFPMVGVWISMVGIVDALNRYLCVSKSIKIFFIVFVLLLATGTSVRAQHWADMRSLVKSEVIRNPNSSRNQYTAGLWYFSEFVGEKNPSTKSHNYAEAVKHFEQAYKVDSMNLGGLLSLIRLNNLLDLDAKNIWVSELVYRLSEVQIERENMKQIDDFFKCNIGIYCHTDINLINEMVLALEENKKFIPKYKSYFYSLLGNYFLHENLNEYALFYFAKANETEPDNQDHILNLATMLLICDRYDDSKQYFYAIDRSKLAAVNRNRYDDFSQEILSYSLKFMIKKIIDTDVQ